jgi:hypothetical protein
MPMLSADAMPMLCQCYANAIYADAIYAAHAHITFNI